MSAGTSTLASMREKPTADEFLAAFAGRIYRPTYDDVTVGRGSGWGASGGEVSSLSLRFGVGRRDDSVIVEVSTEPSRVQPVQALHHLVLEFALIRRPRFPMVIERGRAAMSVEGRKRTFVTYTAGAAAVATANLGDIEVTIRCPRRRLVTLALERIQPAELRRALRRTPTRR